MAVLLFGVLAGLVVAYFFLLIPFDFSKEIIDAKKLGIMSLTILDNYPKSRDILNYFAILFFPLFFSLGGWFLWASGDRKKALQDMFLSDDKVLRKGKSWIFCLIMVVLFYLIIYFSLSRIFQPNWGWPFLAEEGEILAWAHSILSGGVYGKDFFCLYGPMLIYPLAWMMKIFGATIPVERVYTFLLNISAYTIICAFLYKTLRFKTIFILSFFIYFVIFAPFGYLSPNTSLLRVSLGLLPLLVAYIYMENGNKYLLTLTGLVVGQSFLFSQEVGLCALFSLTCVFSIKGFIRREWKIFRRDVVNIYLACFISTLPFLIYFFTKDSLGFFFESLYGYPKLVILGFGGLPFPDLEKFLKNPFAASHFIFYFTIFTYIFSAIFIVTSISLKKNDNKTFLKISLLVFGALLFRVALGRSDMDKAFFVSPPAFLLLFLTLDASIASALKSESGAFKKANYLLISLLVALFVIMFVKVDVNKRHLKEVRYELNKFEKKWKVDKTMGEKIPELERSDIYFESPDKIIVKKIHEFLASNTEPDDYVYFFPNEAVYYFLFNRRNPTRYAMSYLAVTREQRLELVADLEKNKPVYVIYTINTWRPDNILENVQVPEIYSYILKKYQRIKYLEGVQVWKRIVF